MTDRFDYRGIPGEYVHELGKLVVVAGNTEMAAHLILEALALDGLRQVNSWKTLRNRACGRVEGDGTPDCTDVTAAEVIAWFDAAKAAMDERNTLFHTGYLMFPPVDGWAAIFPFHIRERQMYSVLGDRPGSIRRRLEQVSSDGHALWDRLLHDRSRFHYRSPSPFKDDPDHDPERIRAAQAIYPVCPFRTSGK